jgi:hypothetical protein
LCLEIREKSNYELIFEFARNFGQRTMRCNAEGGTPTQDLGIKTSPTGLEPAHLNFYEASQV